STGPVQVADLQAAGAAAAHDPFADLDSLSLDLPDVLPTSLPGIPATPGALRAELQSLFEQRRFQELLARAQRDQGTIVAIPADPELQRMAATAQERMEAEPYVLKFLGAARQALQAGQTAEVGRLLDKARALDASHPGIAELEKARGASPATATPSITLPPP